MNLRTLSSAEQRRTAVEQETGVSLPNIGTFSLDEAAASSRNCENMIGVVQVPMGVAGPMEVRSLKSEVGSSSAGDKQTYYVPLATTEGALVASINRGCKAITEAGGATVFSERVGTTRGPVFRTTSLAESFTLKTWIEGHQEILNNTAQQTSSHISLLSSFIHIEGRLVFVRFAFDTQDAMGMNMVTVATEQLGKLIADTTGAIFLSVSGNFCVDKKASWQNAILGRGFRAWSEVVLPTSIITGVLKTTNEALYDLWQAKCLIGGAITGTIGANGHAANAIAALFLATGQDLAHVTEGSMTVTSMEKLDNALVVNVSLPALLVGTVGGGTGLATQHEALSLLGLAGGNQGHNASRFAELTAAVVLAGEISELAALSNHTLVSAHQQLARGK